MCIYSSIVEKLTRNSFAAVERHNYEEVLKGVAAKNLTHRAESGIAEAKAPQIQS